MFKSYQHLHAVPYIGTKPFYSWRYKIVDDDFEYEGIGSGCGLEVGTAVIDTYSLKGLPVASNLIRAFLWYVDQYDDDLDNMIIWSKAFNPRWPEVAKDMQKYLLFS